MGRRLSLVSPERNKPSTSERTTPKAPNQTKDKGPEITWRQAKQSRAAVCSPDRPFLGRARKATRDISRTQEIIRETGAAAPEKTDRRKGCLCFAYPPSSPMVFFPMSLLCSELSSLSPRLCPSLQCNLLRVSRVCVGPKNQQERERTRQSGPPKMEHLPGTRAIDTNTTEPPDFCPGLGRQRLYCALRPLQVWHEVPKCQRKRTNSAKGMDR